MGIPVRELEHRITQSELDDWKTFYNMSPWGSEVEDDRFGVVLSVINSVAGGKWQNPNVWFKRHQTEAERDAEKKSNQDKAIMAEKARLNFRALSAAREARAQQGRPTPPAK